MQAGVGVGFVVSVLVVVAGVATFGSVVLLVGGALGSVWSATPTDERDPLPERQDR